MDLRKRVVNATSWGINNVTEFVAGNYYPITASPLGGEGVLMVYKRWLDVTPWVLLLLKTTCSFCTSHHILHVVGVCVGERERERAREREREKEGGVLS